MADLRCEECGAELTEAEERIALEDGGKPLCAVHAAEAVPVAQEDPEVLPTQEDVV